LILSRSFRETDEPLDVGGVSEDQVYPVVLLSSVVLALMELRRFAAIDSQLQLLNRKSLLETSRDF